MSAQLPVSVTSRGLDLAQWNTLCNSLFPGARPESVLLAVDYCKARNLDVMKKPCHIVPMRVKVGRDYEWRDVIMPGIYELRTTAMRTQQYCGMTAPIFGPMIDYKGVQVPEWCTVNVRRWHPGAGQIVEYPGRAVFAEVCGTDRDGNLNDRWSRAPMAQLFKCCEADGLRRAFPDELGGMQSDEEIRDLPLPKIEVTADRSSVAEHSTDNREAEGSNPSGPTTDAEYQSRMDQAAEEAQMDDTWSTAGAVATEAQVRMMFAKLRASGKKEGDLKAHFKIEHIRDLPFDLVSDALRWIEK